MTNENIVNLHDKLLARLTKLDHIPQLHRDVVGIAESCVDQLQELMPGTKVRVIVETPDSEAHHEPDRLANADGGVNLVTKHVYSEGNHVLIITEQ